MHRYGWVGNKICPLGFGGGYFGIWHFMILIGAILVVIALATRKKKNSSNLDAIESLKMLYVKGDISEEEYLKRKSVIERK